MRILATITIVGALLVPAAAAAAGEAETRIADAFVELGMSEKKAACYGGIITQELDANKAQKAASIVESASDSTEVREAVMNAGVGYMDAFSAAHNQCGA